MGAAYVVTGSVNQACVESGSSDAVRKMLAEAGQADVTMAPAADMFEMGVKVQVLKRGTMFAMRAAKLYELYRSYPSWRRSRRPSASRSRRRCSARRSTRSGTRPASFFQRRDPAQVPKAEADPRHRMALVFRWYLGLSSRWANAGEAGRQLDYQVWCGPAMGAFNEWAKGSFLEQPAEPHGGRRSPATCCTGRAWCLRRQALRQQGVNLPDECFPLAPADDGRGARRLA